MPAAGPFRRKILVVDDSRVQRRILSASLQRWGYCVLEADSGLAALAICAREPVDMILSDWMMPGMTGPEFCRAFRARPRDGYGYFILLTSKSDKSAVAEGLEAGADDFLTKPLNSEELRARLTAGERILRMERELQDKNRLVSSTLSQLQAVYDSLDRDLVQARKLQQSLVRERARDFGPAQVSLLLRPSGHVGGDLVGFFPIGAGHVGCYAIDVAGHGVTSALLTARLAGMFSGDATEQNIALAADPAGRRVGRDPAAVAALMNRQMLAELETEHYCTLAYAEVDLGSGRVRLVQAGHPHPALLRADGTVEYLGEGGLPVGLFADAAYQGFEVTLRRGDRLLLVSDGVTECPEPGGAELGEDGLARMMHRLSDLRGPAFLEALMWDLHRFAGGADLQDDVSAVLVEYSGR